MRRLSVAILALCAAPLFARELPPIDELASARVRPDAAAAVARKAAGLARAGSALPVEARLNVPTFVWAAPDAATASGEPIAKGAHPTDAPPPKQVSAARGHMGRFSGLYDLNATDVDGATVAMVHDTGRGPVIVKFRQQIGGIEVFREEMNVVMNSDLQLVGIGGYLTSAATPAASGRLTFDVSEPAAVAAAASDLTGRPLAGGGVVSSGTRDGYSLWASAAIEEAARLKKVYFHVANGLEPGYYVEVAARDRATNEMDLYAYVISAIDAHILYRNSLKSDAMPVHAKVNAGAAYTYRVWADANGMIADSPSGTTAHPKANPVPDGFQAPIVAQTDVTIANYPFSMNDPWLPAGASETVGNNVDAYADLFYPDGLSPVATPATPANGDFRAQATGSAQFLHLFDSTNPYNHIQREAAITQLFFTTNFLHDWFYDAGFNEAAGNAQQDNFGRGGVGGDRLKAEADDTSGTNNANMYTPADGASPRMQMYMFYGNPSGPVFNVTAPQAAAGGRAAGASSSGPQAFHVSAEVLFPVPADACSALTNASAVAGKIVIVDMDTAEGSTPCTAAVKIANIAAAGAAGGVVIGQSSWPDSVLALTDPVAGLKMPILSISFNGAASIRTEIAAAHTVTGTMVRESAVDRDGALDNQIVAHEWGHYLSNRLIGNSSGLAGGGQSRGMGEGWSDFLSLLITVRADDVNVASNATWNGVYPVGTYAYSGGIDGGTNQGYYFGVRRSPYSTDFARNGLTFKHIEHGVALPTTAPIRPNGSSNAEVHNSGEVWAEMLWECYASLLRDTLGASPRLTFAQAQTRMKEYLVASMKLTPLSPTFLEARDALLAAAAASDTTDYVLFYQAFARRGAGVGAVAPDRYDVYNRGVVESFVSAGGVSITTSALADSASGCDADGVLDANENGTLTFTVKNTGTVTLTGMTCTVSSGTASVTLPSGGSVAVPTLAPLQTANVSVPVAMANGTSGIQVVDFSVSFAHASLSSNPTAIALHPRGNFDLILAASAKDTGDGPEAPWTVSSALAGAVEHWKHKSVGAISMWHGPDNGTTADERLVSPPMTVGADGMLKIDFDDKWSFEYDPYYGEKYDGAVIEMSRNGGAFVDVGAPAYNGIISYNYDNPLRGRRAVVGSGGPRHVTLTPAVAPGDVVIVRFRVGTDYVVGAEGWDLDNITFTGINEAPFALVQADSGCTKSTLTLLRTSVNPARSGAPVTFTATVVGALNPSGTVTFRDGANMLGTANAANVATLTTSALSTGTHVITADYAGATGHAASTSIAVQQIVDDCSAVPVATMKAPASVPLGGTATLTATGSASSGTVYRWFKGAAGDTSSPVGTAATINVAIDETSTYWLRVINGCGTADSAPVTIAIVTPTKFFTVPPCRIFDSRNSYNGPLPASSTTTVYAFYCGIPYGARAISANVTAVGASTSGWLTFFPYIYSGPNAPPLTSTINYRAKKTRANNTIIQLKDSSWIAVFNGGIAPVHFIIDVNGYFY